MESPGGSQTQQHLKNLIYGQIAPRATLKIRVMLQYLAEAGHSNPRYCGRLPPGRRGLKRVGVGVGVGVRGRLPPGRRGLKPVVGMAERISTRRLPPGRRGLKQRQTISSRQTTTVAFPPEGVD